MTGKPGFGIPLLALTVLGHAARPHALPLKRYQRIPAFKSWFRVQNASRFLITYQPKCKKPEALSRFRLFDIWLANSDKSENLLHNFYMSDIINYSWLPPVKNTVLLHQKYVQERRNMEQIARDFKCSSQTVRKHLRAAGIPTHSFLRSSKKPKDKKISATVIDLNEQRTTQTILEYRRLGMSAQKIADIMNQMGIPPRFRAKAWHYRVIHRIVHEHGMGRVKLNR
jgi:DNA-binding phage protein